MQKWRKAITTSRIEKLTENKIWKEERSSGSFATKKRKSKNKITRENKECKKWRRKFKLHKSRQKEKIQERQLIWNVVANTFITI